MTTRSILLLSLLVISIRVPSLAADAASPATQRSGDVVVDGDVQANAAANAMLQRRMPELHFNANAFSDVIDFMRDVTSANIFVDWASLDAAGVSRDAPVTARLRDVKFGTALNLVLQSASVNTEVIYFVEAGVINITTADRATHRIMVRTYDVGDLAPAEQADRLRQMIIDSVDPSSWKQNGGSAGTITVFKTKLVVTNNALAQQKVSALLESLREHEPAPTGLPNSAKLSPATKPVKAQQ